MRADKQYPRRVYIDFIDWLHWHPAWLIGLLFGYAYYLATTEEI